MRITYRPGTWNALVADRGVIVLPPRADASFIADVWHGLDGATGLSALVDLLTLQSGGSLAGLPNFVAVTAEQGDVRIAVRGPLDVVVHAEEGEHTFSGRDVSTWSERIVRRASRVVIRADSSEEPSFPLSAGVVRAAEIVIDVVDDEQRIAPSSPAAMPVGDMVQPLTDAPTEGETAEEPPTEGAHPLPPSFPVPELPALPLFTPLGTSPAVSSVSPLPVPTDAHSEAQETPQPAPLADVNETVDEHSISAADTLHPEDVNSAPDVDEFDLLWGDTIHRPAAGDVPTVTSTDLSAQGAPPLPGDHDGATISVAEARAQRDSRQQSAPDAPTVVIPTIEPETHAAGRIRLSTGQSATLDRTVIIGRRPRSARASGTTMPHLIAVESPQQDISRSHLEIRPEGDTVVVIDLHTTNGSTLIRQGADPMRLHPGEQTIVLSGDVVDLGDGVTVTFEDMP